jgi:ornithine carbamoyltransferase
MIRHFIDLDSIPAETLKGILTTAHDLKSRKFTPPQIFEGLSLAMVFDKLSTRTRFSFDVAMKQLGGHTVVSTMGEMQMGGSESIESTAKVLSRFVDAIMVRMSDQDMMAELAKHATVPVINGMTNNSHPCQIMADIMTIEEKFGTVEGKKIAWFGDFNNVSRTFMQAAPIFGFELTLAVPADLIPKDAATYKAVTFTSDAKEAAKGAHVLVTDTWVSLGQEGKAIEKFGKYQVNSDLMALADKDAIFMHCLPIHEWEEVSEEVARSDASVIYDEAENRLHVQKAILAWCLEEAGVEVTAQSDLFTASRNRA